MALILLLLLLHQVAVVAAGLLLHLLLHLELALPTDLLGLLVLQFLKRYLLVFGYSAGSCTQS